MADLPSSLRDKSNLTVASGVNKPAVAGNGSFVGQIYIQENQASAPFEKSVWRWDGGTWQWISGSILVGSGTPVGTIDPDGIGQGYKDQNSGLFYVATGLTNNDWS